MPGWSRRLPAPQWRARNEPNSTRTREISGDGEKQGKDEAALLRARLAEAAAANAERDREIAELRSLNRHLEQRAIGAHRTLAYGLGQALIEARGARGLLALPRRLWRLRLKQKAKRRTRVPDSGVSGIAARLRFVDPALERLTGEGAEAAAAWVRALPDREAGPKARAMAELALVMARDDPRLGAALGEEAAALDPSEARLLALALVLRERGLVATPAAIVERTAAARTFSEAQAVLTGQIAEDARILRDGHPDRALREVRLAANRGGGEILIAHAAADRLDHRVARIAALAAEGGFRARAVEVEKFAIVPASPPPLLVHLLAGEAQAARRVMTTARLAGAPVLLDVGAIAREAIVTPESERGRVERARLAWLVETADGVVARGAAVGEALRGVSDVEIEAVEDIVTVAPASERDREVAAAEFDIVRDGIVIGVIARPDDPDRAGPIARLVDPEFSGAEANLVFMGRGPAMAELAARAARSGMGERAHFIGVPLAERWPALFGTFTAIVFADPEPATPGSGIETARAVAAQAGAKVLVLNESGGASPESPISLSSLLADARAEPSQAREGGFGDAPITRLHAALARLPA